MGTLFVITARDVDSALILRRGPSDWFHLISWQTSHDVFTHGAWFKGRIYCENCDLSPNGQLFIYAAFKGNGAPGFSQSYTAISRPPWLHALAITYAQSTYGIGGRFVSDSEISTGPLYIPAPQGASPTELRSLKTVRSDLPRRQSSDEVPAADWSGHDRRGRLIFTCADTLWRQNHRTRELVADFSNLRPDPQPAPEWARTPLR